MRFQILAPVALLAGITSAVPTNSSLSSVSLYPQTGFAGNPVSWPVDGKCHDIADKAPKLKAVGSVKVYGDVLCHLHDETGCQGNNLNVGAPGAPDLLMIMKWAVRAKAILCEKTAPKDK